MMPTVSPSNAVPSASNAVPARNVANIYTFQALINASLWMPIWVVFLNQDAGLTLSEVFLIAGMGWLIQAVGEVPSGAISDAYGRRATKPDVQVLVDRDGRWRGINLRSRTLSGLDVQRTRWWRSRSRLTAKAALAVGMGPASSRRRPADGCHPNGCQVREPPVFPGEGRSTLGQSLKLT